MATFYLSSTYEDLKDCRQRVTDALRKMGHTVVGMENYTASGAAPSDKCLKDVAGCEYYIGIFAWRYGYIPNDGNLKKRSITELEYRKAIEAGIEPFIFILHHEAAWPMNLVDNNKKQIEMLRRYLSDKHLISTFRDCAELTEAVLTAVGRVETGLTPTLPNA